MLPAVVEIRRMHVHKRGAVSKQFDVDKALKRGDPKLAELVRLSFILRPCCATSRTYLPIVCVCGVACYFSRAHLKDTKALSPHTVPSSMTTMPVPHTHSLYIAQSRMLSGRRGRLARLAVRL